MAGPLTVVTREQWHARAPRPGATGASIERLRGLAVHHSGTPEDREDKHEHCLKRVQGAQSYHQVQRGWSDIAYQWVVCWHGSLYLGRSVTIRSASQGSDFGNERYHSICVLGRWGDELLPATVTGALTEARRRLLAVAPRARRVYPHSAFTATECPGGALTHWCSAHTVDT